MKLFGDAKLDKYLDPKQGLIAIDKFAKKHKLNAEQIKKLKSLQTLQIHKQPKHIKKHWSTITAPEPIYNVQIDLMEVSNLHPVVNRKVKYLFNIMDVYSRYLWVFPMTNKRSSSTAEALTKWLKIVKKQHGKIPTNLNSDDGSEFKGAFKTVLKKNNIQHYVSVGAEEHHNKQAIIERVHRTLRNMIQRYLDVYNTQKYIDDLPSLIDNYNNTIHSTLKATPKQVIEGKRKNKQTIQRAKFIPIGTKVRTLLKRGVFAKGSKPYFSKAVYIVTSYDKLGHKLKNEKTGSELKRTYKTWELQPITDVTETVTRVTRQSKKHEKQIEEERIRKKLKRLGLEYVDPNAPRAKRKRK